MSKPDKNSQTLETALTASCQTILAGPQPILITPLLSRYSLLVKIKAKLGPEYANERRPFADLNDVLSVSPSCARTLHNWASELATDQDMCPWQI